MHDILFKVACNEGEPDLLSTKVAQVAQAAARNRMTFDCAPSDGESAYDVHASTDDESVLIAFKLEISDLVEYPKL